MSRYDKKTYQFEYFSKSYQNFENDFYKFSNINTPLTFLLDDITHYLESSSKNYFKLSSQFTKDNKNHYFFFERKAIKENKNIVNFSYLEHRSEHELQREE